MNFSNLLGFLEGFFFLFHHGGGLVTMSACFFCLPLSGPPLLLLLFFLSHIVVPTTICLHFSPLFAKLRFVLWFFFSPAALMSPDQ